MKETEKIIKTLYEENFDALLQNALSIVKDLSESEEIVQNVFVKLWQNSHLLKDVENIKGYLYRAVSNSCKNYLKHLKVKRGYEARLIKSIEHDSFNNHTLLEQEESIVRINKALNDLPDKWRQVFLMSRFEGFKYHEIAEKKKISKKTVEKYITASLKKLRSDLSDLL